MAKTVIMISGEQFDKAMEIAKQKALNHSYNPWFNGDETQYDEWAGDILFEVAEDMLAALGILVEEDDEADWVEEEE